MVTLARCFFYVAKQELVFNNRSTAAPGTNKKPKLCGTSAQVHATEKWPVFALIMDCAGVKMAQLQIISCKQVHTL